MSGQPTNTKERILYIAYDEDSKFIRSSYDIDIANAAISDGGFLRSGNVGPPPDDAYLAELDFNDLPKSIHVLNESFIFETTEISEASVEFVVYERISFKEDSPSEISPYLKGMIKWDGCSHIHLLEADEEEETVCESSYRHICGLGDWQNTIEMYELTYKYAMSLISKADKSEIWR